MESEGVHGDSQVQVQSEENKRPIQPACEPSLDAPRRPRKYYHNRRYWYARRKTAKGPRSGNIVQKPSSASPITEIDDVKASIRLNIAENDVMSLHNGKSWYVDGSVRAPVNKPRQQLAKKNVDHAIISVSSDDEGISQSDKPVKQAAVCAKLEKEATNATRQVPVEVPGSGSRTSNQLAGTPKKSKKESKKKRKKKRKNKKKNKQKNDTDTGDGIRSGFVASENNNRKKQKLETKQERPNMKEDKGAATAQVSPGKEPTPGKLDASQKEPAKKRKHQYGDGVFAGEDKNAKKLKTSAQNANQNSMSGGQMEVKRADIAVRGTVSKTPTILRVQKTAPTVASTLESPIETIKFTSAPPAMDRQPDFEKSANPSPAETLAQQPGRLGHALTTTSVKSTSKGPQSTQQKRHWRLDDSDSESSSSSSSTRTATAAPRTASLTKSAASTTLSTCPLQSKSTSQVPIQFRPPIQAKVSEPVNSLAPTSVAAVRPQPTISPGNQLKTTPRVYAADVDKDLLLEEVNKNRFFSDFLNELGFDELQCRRVQHRVLEKGDSLKNAIKYICPHASKKKGL